jgi:exopolyphosphatase/guanosine-5'-triphosphate,3'-diphosphate pyrophosphatase
MLPPLDASPDLPPSRVVAFMDIGSNSVRLLLVRVNPNQTYTVLTEQKEIVRLGETVFVDGRLHAAAIRRTVNACQDFTALARARGATETVAVATSATREAKNQGELLRALKRQANLDVRVISGKEEARLIYLGTSHVAREAQGPALFMDVGGGSTEIAVGDPRQYAYLDSLRLGAIRLSATFHLDREEPVSEKRYDRVRDYVRDTAAPTFKRVQRFRLGQFIGSSGTIENLADIVYRVRYNRKRDRSDSMRYSDLVKIIDLLQSLPLEDRRSVPGINPERADIILGGGAIVDVFMEELDLREIHPTDRGMRDGLLFDYLANSEHAAFYGGVPIRERSVLQLARACGSDEAHTRVVARLATELFDSAKKLGVHRYGSEERNLLSFAALLHDAGAFLSYDNQHEHAWYLISSADLLGLNRTETGIIAALAFFSRKGFPKRGHPKLEGLDPGSQSVVRTLTAFLRIADSLDRSRQGLVDHARLQKGRDGMVLRIKARGDITTDLWGVRYNHQAIEKLLGRRVSVQ